MKNLTGVLIIACLFTASASHALDLNQLKSNLKEKLEKNKKHPVAEIPPTLVCDASAQAKLCYAFVGEENKNKGRKGNEFACKLMKGQFTEPGSCPSEKALGRCDVATGQPKEYVLFYYSGGRITRSGAERDCVNAKSSLHVQGAGTWTGMN